MYIPGYWDYPLEDRGTLNAPVQFSQPLWNNPGWSYCPQYALGLGYGNGWGSGGLFTSLFIGPDATTSTTATTAGVGWGGRWLARYRLRAWFPGRSWGLGGWGGYRPWYCGGRGFYNLTWSHYCYLNRNNPNYVKHVGNTAAGRALGVKNLRSRM
ncbi:MAG: hypothetical protein U0792_10000 [Gemmataceae bacterium]